MKTWRISGITLNLDDDATLLPKVTARVLSLPESVLRRIEIVKKAVDARRNRPPRWSYVLRVQIDGEIPVPSGLQPGVSVHEERPRQPDEQPAAMRQPDSPVVVVGAGPAGLFAAYELAAAGAPVLLCERGRPIEQRVGDVELFWRQGMLDTQSNVLFGEGGAGTFSDGKLTSRTKSPLASRVRELLVSLGAPDDILTDAKPHIGTDLLRKVVVNFRRKLIEMGCRIRFEAAVSDLEVHHGRVRAVRVASGQEIQTGAVILAIGQSADDTYAMLHDRGVAMTAKPFAMGLRAEHPQELINRIQYGQWFGHPKLPPADYFVSASLPELNRSVYTFCMCPGGEVIGCAACPGAVITNGMSSRDRQGGFANAAVVVNVRVEDFSPEGHPLAGLEFRRRWEQKAFEAGGGGYFAPAQNMMDFIAGTISNRIGRTTFLPGVTSADLAEVVPDFVAEALRLGLRRIDRKMPGFATSEAHLIGVETRTSSPLRLCRRPDGQSESVSGLYPCGEGAGYAGGIISSAIDGMTAARRVLATLS